MRALVLDEPGGPFRIVDIPRPKPNVGEILVRVLASIALRAMGAVHDGDRLEAVERVLKLRRDVQRSQDGKR